jgi:hypothetical protein
MTKRWICLPLLMAAAAWGADVTGNWSGTMVLTTGTRGAAYLKMKQNGTVITGTTGPSDQTQFPITSGRIDGNQVTVEAKPGDPVLKLVLKLESATLSGDVFEDNEKIGTISMQKVNP